MRVSFWAVFAACLGLLYLGPLLRWWARPTVTDLLFFLLLFILYALVEIANLLERMIPPKAVTPDHTRTMGKSPSAPSRENSKKFPA